MEIGAMRALHSLTATALCQMDHMKVASFPAVSGSKVETSRTYKVKPPNTNTYRKTTIMYHMHTFGSTYIWDGWWFWGVLPYFLER